MAQTSYSIDIPKASYPGQIADNSEVLDIISAAAVLAAMTYGTFGIIDAANTNGSDDLAVKAPAASGDITGVGTIRGVVVADQARAQDPTFSNPTYPQNSEVPLMKRGRIYMYAETAMTDGAIPFIRFTANGALYVGNIRNDADAGKAVQPTSPIAVVVGNTSAAGFCVVQLNIP